MLGHCCFTTRNNITPTARCGLPKWTFGQGTNIHQSKSSFLGYVIWHEAIAYCSNISKYLLQIFSVGLILQCKHREIARHYEIET